MWALSWHAYGMKVMFLIFSTLGTWGIHKCTRLVWKIPKRMMVACAKKSAKSGRWGLTVVLSVIYVSVVAYFLVTSGNSGETVTSYAEGCWNGNVFQCWRYVSVISVEVGWKFLNTNVVSRWLIFPAGYGNDPCMSYQMYIPIEYPTIEKALPRDYVERYAICASTYWSINILQSLYGQTFCDVVLEYEDHPLHLLHRFTCARAS
jgi:hypothetical protein